MVVQREILLCSTDAGGARNVAPLIPHLQMKGFLITYIVCSDTIGIVSEFSGDRVEIINIDNADIDLRTALTKLRPEAVICGTARAGRPDRLLIPIAKAMGIKTIVVFDEWFQYKVRFDDPNTGKLEYLPDIIAVQDEIAKEEAIAEGLPESVLKITGSPSFSVLTKRIKNFESSHPEKPDFLRDIGQLPLITFMSETHARDFGDIPGTSGPLGSYLGYSELSVRLKLAEILERLCHPLIFIEKLHPSDTRCFTPAIQSSDIRWYIVRKTDLSSLFWYSSLVIGMTSITLLEAAIFGRPTASFQPGSLRPNHCTAVRLGLIPKFVNTDELYNWCRSKLENASEEGRNEERFFPFATPEAGQNIVDLIPEGAER